MTNVAGAGGPGGSPETSNWDAQTAGVGASVRRGALQGGLSQVVLQALSLVATVVLARLLAEYQFGIIAAANSIVALSTLLLGVGVGAAVVRRPDLTQAWLSTVTWAALLAASGVALLLIALAPLLASLYGVPGSAPYITALAWTTFSLFGAVPLALLRRRLAFGAFWRVQVLSMMCYITVEIGLALVGFGVWAVVIGQLVLVATQTIGAFLAARWLPSRVFRPSLLRDDAGFAVGMWTNGGLGYGLRNADYWLVGSTLGAAALGTYYIAYLLPNILRTRIAIAAGTVLGPIFARSQFDPALRNTVYIASMRLQSGIGFPAMAGIAVLSDPIISLFFGSDWIEAAAAMRWVALAALLEFVAATANQVAEAHKRTRPIVAAQVVRLISLLVFATLAATVWRSIEAVAVAVLASTVLWCCAQQLLVAGRLGLPFRLIASDILAIACTTGVMSVTVGGIVLAMDAQSAALQLGTGVLVGAASYFLFGRLAFPKTFSPLIAEMRRLAQSFKSGTRA